MWCNHTKHKSQPSIILMIAIFILVPLNNELLNLWNDFHLIVEYLKSVEGIVKLIESI